MLVTLLPIVTETREVQPLNAYALMLITLSRIVRYLSDLLFWNSWAMDVIPSVRDSSASHPWNTFVEIFFTPLPIVKDARELQPENAYAPMLVTLSGIVTETREVQFRKT